MNLKKLGLLTTTTLLSMALLTSCKSDEETPSVPDTPTTTPSIGAGTSTTDTDTKEGDLDIEESEGEASEGEGEDEATDSEESEETEDKEDTSGSTEEADAKLSNPDVTLTEVGATYKLTVSGTSVSGVSYTSDKQEVATVGNDGTVTAVGTGTATITVKFTTSGGKSQSLTATIRCDIPEVEPEPEVTTPEVEATPDPEPTPEPEAPSSSSVDLSSFYNSMSSAHSFGSMEPVTGEFLSNFFPGISGVSTSQQHIYMAMMTSTAVEIALVEVANASDVDTVKGIFQSRINSQVDGGAWYPETIESWKNNSRVVSNGNYVMMIVHPNCDAVVGSFNGLF